MSLPVILHWKMKNAPQLRKVNGGVNTILLAALVNGFNTVTATSVTVSNNVATINLPTNHGFNVFDTVEVGGVTNLTGLNTKWRVATSDTNLITVNTSGIANGTATGTITVKFASLGWTRPYSGTNLGAYRQGGSSTTKRYIRIYDGTISTDVGRFYSRAYETMTAISTGTNPFPSTAQVTGNGMEGLAPIYLDPATNIPWLIVGTPRHFYYFSGYQADYLNAYTDFSQSDVHGVFFGDLQRGSKASDAYSAIICNFYMPSPSTSAYMSRDANNTYGPMSSPLMSLTGLPDGTRGADPGDNGIRFFDGFMVFEGSTGVLRGFLPGTLQMSHSPIYTSIYSPFTILSSVQNINGRVMLCRNAWGNYDFAIELDNDWGDT